MFAGCNIIFSLEEKLGVPPEISRYSNHAFLFQTWPINNTWNTYPQFQPDPGMLNARLRCFTWSFGSWSSVLCSLFKVSGSFLGSNSCGASGWRRMRCDLFLKVPADMFDLVRCHFICLQLGFNCYICLTDKHNVFIVFPVVIWNGFNMFQPDMNKNGSTLWSDAASGLWYKATDLSSPSDQGNLSWLHRNDRNFLQSLNSFIPLVYSWGFNAF